jgi:hypothetical protein
MKLILAETSEIAAALTATELIATAGRYLRPLRHDNGTGITEQLEGLRLVARLAADGSAGTAWTRSDGDGPERTIWWSFFRTTSQELLRRELAVFLASPAGQELLSGVHADVTGPPVRASRRSRSPGRWQAPRGAARGARPRSGCGIR